jgi:hypothetical protein
VESRIFLSAYSELLRATVVDEEGQHRRLPELIAQVLSRRSELERDARDGHEDPAYRMVSALAYDAALVALCRRFDLPETLTDGAEVTGARREAEAVLAARLPAMQQMAADP